MKWKFFFLTWLYSVAINTILVALLTQGSPPSYLPFGEWVLKWIEGTAFIGMLSLPFSMPGLLVLILASEGTRYFMDPRKRFTCIVIFCLVGVFAGYLLVWGIMGLNPFSEVLVCVALSFGAVLAALFINKRFFYRAFMPGYKKSSWPDRSGASKICI